MTDKVAEQIRQEVQQELRETFAEGRKTALEELAKAHRKSAWQDVRQAVADYGRAEVIGWAEDAPEADGDIDPCDQYREAVEDQL